MAAHNFLVNLLSCHTNRKTGQKQSSEVFCKERCYCKFCKIHKKHLWQNLFFNKVAGLKPATLLKKSPWHRCFPMNSGKFLRTSFLQNISVRPLLKGQCKFLVDISLFRVSYWNIRAMWNLVKVKRLQWRSHVYFVNFEQISHIFAYNVDIVYFQCWKSKYRLGSALNILFTKVKPQTTGLLDDTNQNSFAFYRQSL